MTVYSPILHAVQPEVDDAVAQAKATFDDLATFLANTTYQASDFNTGDPIVTLKEGFRYEVVPSGGDLTNSHASSVVEVVAIEAPNGNSIAQWNAVPDDDDTAIATANTAAIQAAIDSGFPIYVPDNEWYYDGQITNPNLTPIFGPGTLKFTGSGEHAFVFGELGAGANSYEKAIKSEIRVMRSTKDFSDDYAAVALQQCFGLELHVEGENFRYGLSLETLNGGCAYNHITCGRMKDTCVGLRQWVKSGGTNAYINGNTVFNMRTSVDAGTSVAQDVLGIEFRHDEDGGNVMNGNAYYNFKIEGSNGGAGDRAMIKGTGTNTSVIARDNSFINFRYETDNERVIAGKGISRNRIDLVFPANAGSPNDPTTLLGADTDAAKLALATNVISGVESGPDFQNRVVKLASIRRENLCETTSSSGQIMAPSYGIWATSSTHQKRPGSIGAGQFTLSASNTILGVRFDMGRETRPEKRRIIVVTHAVGTAHGRVGAKCFNSSSTLLTGDDDCSLSYNSSLTAHRTGSDGDSAGINGTTIEFGDDVDHAIVGALKGSANAVLIAIDFYAYLDSAITLGHDSNGAGFLTQNPVSDAIPAVATGDKQGMMVHDISAGGVAGWFFNGTSWAAI